MHGHEIATVAVPNDRVHVGGKTAEICSYYRTRSYKVAYVAHFLLPEANLPSASLGQVF
jgi:hypothetical protein